MKLALASLILAVTGSCSVRTSQAQPVNSTQDAISAIGPRMPPSAPQPFPGAGQPSTLPHPPEPLAPLPPRKVSWVMDEYVDTSFSRMYENQRVYAVHAFLYFEGTALDPPFRLEIVDNIDMVPLPNDNPHRLVIRGVSVDPGRPTLRTQIAGASRHIFELNQFRIRNSDIMTPQTGGGIAFDTWLLSMLKGRPPADSFFDSSGFAFNVLRHPLLYGENFLPSGAALAILRSALGWSRETYSFRQRYPILSFFFENEDPNFLRSGIYRAAFSAESLGPPRLVYGGQVNYPLSFPDEFSGFNAYERDVLLHVSPLPHPVNADTPQPLPESPSASGTQGKSGSPSVGSTQPASQDDFMWDFE